MDYTVENDRQWELAMKRYIFYYDNDVYSRATKYLDPRGKSINALLDDAMYICGSPYHCCQGINWTGDQLAFLMLFV